MKIYTALRDNATNLSYEIYKSGISYENFSCSTSIIGKEVFTRFLGCPNLLRDYLLLSL